jgi:hypothetical protein
MKFRKRDVGFILCLLAGMVPAAHPFAQTATPPAAAPTAAAAAPGQAAAAQKIPAALVCGPYVGNPPRPSFADKFTLDVSNSALAGRRPTRVSKGAEVYKGSVDPTGKIKLSGIARLDDRSSEWSSEFNGQLQDKRPTVLQGTQNVKGALAGIRKCTVTFLLPPADLAKALAPNEAASAQPRPQ